MGERVAALNARCEASSTGSGWARLRSRSRADLAMASRSAALLVLLSALLVAAVQLPAGRVVPQPRCSRHNFVVLKVPSKKKSGTAKGAKKPAGFAKRSAPPAGDGAAETVLGHAAQLAQGSRRQGRRRRRRGGAARPARRGRDALLRRRRRHPLGAAAVHPRGEARRGVAGRGGVGGLRRAGVRQGGAARAVARPDQQVDRSAVHAADDDRLGRRGRPSPAVERRRDRRRRGRRALAARRPAEEDGGAAVRARAAKVGERAGAAAAVARRIPMGGGDGPLSNVCVEGARRAAGDGGAGRRPLQPRPPRKCEHAPRLCGRRVQAGGDARHRHRRGGLRPAAAY